MPFIRGFKALHYNPEKIDDFANVIVPPYDIINSEMRDNLAKRSEYNFVHIDLPIDTNCKSKYENAGELFKEWQEKKIFIRDSHISAYWLRQRFTDIRGIQMERLTLLSLIKIPLHGEENQILPHEKTFEKPIEDRLSLMKTTNAQLSPVFLIFSDTERHINKVFYNLIKNENKQPEICVTTIDGVFNEIWQTRWIEELTEIFKDKTLYIADGHHRFKTAKHLLQEKLGSVEEIKKDRNMIEPYFYLFTGLVAFEDPGLIINAPHRVIKNIEIDYDSFFSKLSVYFNIVHIEGNPIDYIHKRENNCGDKSKTSRCFGFVDKNKGRFILELKEEGLKRLIEKQNTKALHETDVYVLHKLLFEEVLKLTPENPLIYETNPFRCIEMVEMENCSMAFLINPISPHTIKKCADNHEFMPQKATYFFPKIPSGLIVYELSNESL